MEGTAAHWVFAEMLEGRSVAEGAVAPNGVIVTDEMIEGGELTVDAVYKRLDVSGFDITELMGLQIEQPVAVPAVHPQCWGTPDIRAASRKRMVLELFDYKFGHRFVDEYENDQCITYAAGVLDELAQAWDIPAGLLDQALQVNITVIQPRCFYKGAPVRTWSVTASELRGHVNKLAMAAEEALGPNPRAVTNDGCIDCPGRHACPALQKAAYSFAEFAVTSSPVELPPAAASLELRMMERALARLQARVDGLQEAVAVHIRQGAPTPFHRVEQSYGRAQWTIPPEQLIAMGKLYGVDLSKPAVKTPKQAAASGVDEAVIKAYSIVPMGKLKLVPDNPADARRVFGKS